MIKIFLMAFVLACKVSIGKYIFHQVNNIKIEKSWRELGDSCVIKMPKHVRINNQEQTNTLEKYIKVGDAVKVMLWYKGFEQHEEFEGVIAKIKPTIPFELECEDMIWYFKRVPVQKTFPKGTTLKQVVKYLVDEVNAKYSDAQITLSSQLPNVKFDTKEGFMIEGGNNAATSLQKIKEEYGLVSYFNGRELFTGLSEQQSFGLVRHSLQWNVIENDLTYRNADDIKIRIKPVAFTSDNKKIETKKEVGDPNGELRTIHYYGITSETELLKVAENDLNNYKYTGFEGTITTFLYPYARPLMTCELQDPEYGESRSGRYQIDSVVTEFSTNGARRTIELGKKLSV